MFTLELYDRNGVKLQLGDLVKVSNGKDFNFYAEVKYLESEQCITPFHTFSFHSFEKVDSVPENAIKSTEERYNIWYLNTKDAEADNNAEDGKDYLMSWRECEHNLEKRAFRIKLSTIGKQTELF
jgi:hypothetical protein